MVIQSSEFDSNMMVTLQNKETARLRAYFKVDQSINDLSIALKCWVKGANSIVAVQFRVYPESRPSLTTSLLRHIDWDEGGGAAKCLLNVDLRNRDYFSDDCCDFLGSGVNVVEMDFSSANEKPVSLTLKAIALA